MTEQLLTPNDVAKKLAISRATFYRLRHRMLDKGLEYVVVGGIVKYLQSSLDILIVEAARQKKPLA